MFQTKKFLSLEPLVQVLKEDKQAQSVEEYFKILEDSIFDVDKKNINCLFGDKEYCIPISSEDFEKIGEILESLSEDVQS